MTVAVVAPLAAGALLSQFRESITAATAVLVFVALVVAMAAAGSRAAGVTAAVSSAASFDFFLTQPYGTFAITNSDDIEVAVLLLLIGLADPRSPFGDADSKRVPAAARGTSTASSASPVWPPKHRTRPTRSQVTLPTRSSWFWTSTAPGSPPVRSTTRGFHGSNHEAVRRARGAATR